MVYILDLWFLSWMPFLTELSFYPGLFSLEAKIRIQKYRACALIKYRKISYQCSGIFDFNFVKVKN